MKLKLLCGGGVAVLLAAATVAGCATGTRTRQSHGINDWQALRSLGAMARVSVLADDNGASPATLIEGRVGEVRDDAFVISQRGHSTSLPRPSVVRVLRIDGPDKRPLIAAVVFAGLLLLERHPLDALIVGGIFAVPSVAPINDRVVVVYERKAL